MSADYDGEHGAWIERVRRDVAGAGEIDWQARAEAAEAKLAAVSELCRYPVHAAIPGDAGVTAETEILPVADILAIIGSEEGEGRG